MRCNTHANPHRRADPLGNPSQPPDPMQRPGCWAQQATNKRPDGSSDTLKTSRGPITPNPAVPGRGPGTRVHWGPRNRSSTMAAIRGWPPPHRPTSPVRCPPYAALGPAEADCCVPMAGSKRKKQTTNVRALLLYRRNLSAWLEEAVRPPTLLPSLRDPIDSLSRTRTSKPFPARPRPTSPQLPHPAAYLRRPSAPSAAPLAPTSVPAAGSCTAASGASRRTTSRAANAGSCERPLQAGNCSSWTPLHGRLAVLGGNDVAIASRLGVAKVLCASRRVWRAITFWTVTA